MRDPMPRWLTRPNPDRYSTSKQHEQRLARELGGRRLPNSGGARRSKWDQYASQGGDIETEMLLVEHKYTADDAISLKQDWWRKVEEGAARQDKVPALVITFVCGDTVLDLAVLRVVDLQRLTGVQLRPEGRR